MVHVKDIPRYEALGEYARRYPDLDPASYEAFLVLMHTGERIKALVEQRLAKEGTSHARFIVLAKLNREPATRMQASDLASRIGVTKQTMSSLIDGLEKDGFVRREEDPSDRRVTLVALTESGQAFVNRVLPGLYRTQAAMMKALTRDELINLSSVLRRLWVSFDEATCDGSPILGGQATEQPIADVTPQTGGSAASSGQ
ncbi:MAG: MarR family transcriptional regulator [Tepidisphaera sp.]|nr:MarR family transcriptional regulator [Tepidisphaera sp.]